MKQREALRSLNGLIFYSEFVARSDCWALSPLMSSILHYEASSGAHILHFHVDTVLSLSLPLF